MEYLVGLAVIAALYFVFFHKKEEAVVETKPEAAPYKVEAVNAQPVTKAETTTAPEAKKAPAKKPAAKKAPAKAKAPAAKKAPAKKPAAKTTKPKA